MLDQILPQWFTEGQEKAYLEIQMQVKKIV